MGHRGSSTASLNLSPHPPHRESPSGASCFRPHHGQTSATCRTLCGAAGAPIRRFSRARIISARLPHPAMIPAAPAPRPAASQPATLCWSAHAPTKIGACTTACFSATAALSPPVEIAAYFVVSEALTNVAKYAQARAAEVRVSDAAGRVVVQITDDGVGGAAPDSGSGLRGLADRVEALDGHLSVLSARGGGTTVTAELPCGS